VSTPFIWRGIFPGRSVEFKGNGVNNSLLKGFITGKKRSLEKR